ncbi:MAG: hypothetical protein OXC98_12800 [bacterium]|nr:hypothetical protein [Acidimicrobiia bacterium]MCY4651222.1 hypothetical protein [bacterium]
MAGWPTLENAIVSHMTLVSTEVERNRTAATYLLIAVTAISVLPLAMVVVGAPDSPFLFGAFLSAGTSVGALGFLRAKYGSRLRDPAIRALIRKNLVSWPIFFILLGSFEFTFFAWSTQFIDATIATILWGCWPIIFVFLLQRVFSGREARPARYRKITPSLVTLMVFSLIGLAYVVLAQSSGQSGMDWTADSSYLGFALALLSGIFITFNIFTFSWATDLARQANTRRDPRDSHDMELFFITVVVCISNAFTAPVKAGFSLVASEQIQLDVIVMALVIGGTIRVGSSILWRKANLMTHTLGINALGYAEPLFGVLWLALFWEVDISRVDYLIIGTCAIIASNVLINSEVEISRGLKSAILAMWATGAVVYFRDAGPLWSSGRFFGILALLAGAFTLLLGVRFANPFPAVVGKHTRHRPHPPHTGLLLNKYPAVASGLNLARLFTMGVYGAAAVALATVVRPALEGWMGWLVELFAISFCTAIVASAFHATGSLRGGGKPSIDAFSAISIAMDATTVRRERRIANWTSGLVATGTFLSFLYLLWDKWLN